MSDEECEANVMKSIEVGRELIKRGYNPFVPNLYHFLHKNWTDSPDEDVWLDLVSSWLEDCDILLVASTPKGDGSGVAREMKIAKELCIPTYYDIDYIPEKLSEL